MHTFETLSAFIECSSGSTPTVETLKKHIDLLSAFGYNCLYLGVTDAYKIPQEPYFNYNRGGYTKEQFQEIDAYAKEHGMELRLNLQTLAHLGHLSHHDCFHKIMDTHDILMVGEDGTYELIDHMLSSLSESVQSRIIHIGMDEAFNLGLGNYLKKNGYHNKRELLLYHLNRVVEIAKKYNYTCQIWADMFFRLVDGSDFNDNGTVPEDIKELLPQGVELVHWAYHKQEPGVLEYQLSAVKALTGQVSFAGCAWKHYGLAPNNRYSIEVMERQFRICKEMEISHYMVTVWADAGGHCSTFTILPSLFAAAEFAKGKTKMEEIDKDRFKELVGVDFDAFLLTDNLNNPFFKDLETYNNRCYWGLLTDLFIPSYDQILTEGTNEAYGALAEQYAAIDGGAYQMVFDNYTNMARVLSIKMELSRKIRKAYKEGDKEFLQYAATEEIPRLISLMRTFILGFEKCWLWENMAYGLEVHNFFYGGLLTRWETCARRLQDYLENGTAIQELESEALIPCILPVLQEGRLHEMGYTNIISFCWP